MKHYKEYVDFVHSIGRDELTQYACRAKSSATSLVGYLMEKVRDFNVLDFAIFKMFLLTAGLWLGCTFSRVFVKIKAVLFVGCIASWVYLVWRIFLREED